MADAVWVTWERQRRSIEMARALGVPLHMIEGGRNRAWRYVSVITRTLAMLARERPRVVFAQNPSVVLAVLVCALRPLFRYRVVVDRHSNFDFADTERGFANTLSNYTLRRADLTIVTNAWLQDLVRQKGGRGFVLQDPMPTLRAGAPFPLRGRRNVVFVCTYKPDEPIAEVIDAARLLGDEATVYLTGNDRKLSPHLRERLPSNVVLTGFLPDGDYDRLLASANVVLALTTRDHTLLCGAYEAVSVGTPLVLSNKPALAAYFRRGRVPTVETAPAIAAAVREALAREAELRAEIAALRPELADEWRARFAALRTAVGLA